MGDQALVVFTDGETNFSPTVYLHWRGCYVAALLNVALPRMRTGDVPYSAARFCGVCHEDIPGPAGLGIFEGPKDRAEAMSSDFWHGRAGVFLVNVNTWHVECFNGYGFRFEKKPAADAAFLLRADSEPVLEYQLDATRACQT